MLATSIAAMPRSGHLDAQDGDGDRIAALPARTAEGDRLGGEGDRAAATPVVAATPLVAATPGPEGTVGKPVPLGTAAAIGPAWTLRVVAVLLDAEAVLEPNLFTDPLGLDQRFVVVTVALTNHGTEPRLASSVVGFTAVGPSGRSYDEPDKRCGTIPNELPGREVGPGQTIEGALCFAVRTEDAEALILCTDSFITYDEEDRVYFALWEDRRG